MHTERGSRMWRDTPFKILYSCAAFSGVLMYGSYNFVQLRGFCGTTSLLECLSKGADSPTKPTVDPQKTRRPASPLPKPRRQPRPTDHSIPQDKA